MQLPVVLLRSCDIVDLVLTHVATPVFLILSPVSHHVDLRISGHPTTRHEVEQVAQRRIVYASVPTTLVSRLSLEASVDIELQYQRSVVRRAKGSGWGNHWVPEQVQIKT